MPYPSSSKNIISSSEILYPFKKRQFEIPEDLRKSKCTSDENSINLRQKSPAVVPVKNVSNNVHHAIRHIEMKIARIELALELARSSVSFLPINCRGCSAEFYLDRFISGTRGLSVRFKTRFFTPYKFVRECGYTDIEWSIAIQYAGFYLKNLIDANVLHEHLDNCGCRRCRTLTDVDEVSVNSVLQNNFGLLDLSRRNSHQGFKNIKMGGPGQRVDQKYKTKQDSEIGQQRIETAICPYPVRGESSSASSSSYDGPIDASLRAREQQQLAASQAGPYPVRGESSSASSSSYDGPIDASLRAREQQQLAASQAGLYPVRGESSSASSSSYDGLIDATLRAREQQHLAASRADLYPVRGESSSASSTSYDGPIYASLRAREQQQLAAFQVGSYPMRGESSSASSSSYDSSIDALLRAREQQQLAASQAGSYHLIGESSIASGSSYDGPIDASLRAREQQQLAASQAGLYPVRGESSSASSSSYDGPIDASLRAREQQQLVASRAGHSFAMQVERHMAYSYSNAGPSNVSIRVREEQWFAASLAGPSGSNNNMSLYENVTSSCADSTSDLVRVFNVQRPELIPSVEETLQERHRGDFKRSAFSVVENSSKRQRLNPPSVQPNSNQLMVGFTPSAMTEPTANTSRSTMPVPNTERQNRRNQELVSTGPPNNYSIYGRRNGLRHNQNRLREPAIVEHGPGSRMPPQTRRQGNIDPINIVGISPTTGRYLIRHEDNSLHEYEVLSRSSVPVTENNLELPDIPNVNPEIYITPPNEREASPDALELIVGEYMEIDDEVE